MRGEVEREVKKEGSEREIGTEIKGLVCVAPKGARKPRSVLHHRVPRVNARTSPPLLSVHVKKPEEAHTTMNCRAMLDHAFTWAVRL